MQVRTDANTDFAIGAEELHNAKYTFRLLPKLWDHYQGPDDLEWTCVAFSRSTLEDIPDIPGVYAFCVRPSIGGNLCGAYLLYLGKTVRLRRRCREYLARGEAGRERPRIQTMLNQFYGTGYLRFCFARVSGTDPQSVEKMLLEACVPPACTALPASVRAAVNAFGGS